MRASIARERPAWIPAHINANWDADPYAYQTEEEMMPGGIVHGDGMLGFGNLLKKVLKDSDFQLLFDCFMMYRGKDGVRRRIGPDILLIPAQEEYQMGSSYDSETQPIPVCAFELVSPDGDQKDKKSMRLYLEHLKIPTCILIYLVKDDGKKLPKARIAGWRRNPETGRADKVRPDAKGRILIPELQIWVGVEGQTVYVQNQMTGEVVYDDDTERLMRQAAEDENQKLRELLRQHGISL
ncbi:MAG: hypothetical protein AAF639_14930 [Chloroflexota bacterium]